MLKNLDIHCGYMAIAYTNSYMQVDAYKQEKRASVFSGLYKLV
jgi:hypothetical protein